MSASKITFFVTIQKQIEQHNQAALRCGGFHVSGLATRFRRRFTNPPI
jgi:hypothetical protein